MTLIYQIGSTQALYHEGRYALYAICHDGRARWMGIPARDKNEAIALANHWNSGF